MFGWTGRTSLSREGNGIRRRHGVFGVLSGLYGMIVLGGLCINHLCL
jgi:hypothetical protein